MAPKKLDGQMICSSTFTDDEGEGKARGGKWVVAICPNFPNGPRPG